MDLGKRIRQIRKEKNMTLQQVSEKTGISRSNLSEVETGEHGCTSDTLSKLAKCFEVSTDYLLGKTDNPNAQIINVADSDGSITKIEYELLDKVKGLTIDDFIEINKYIDYLKSKKGGNDEK